MPALPDPSDFTDVPAKREAEPLHTAIVGPQKSGKTWSALELATGQQRVFGGDIFLIDTEAGRGNHYADFFRYRYVAFPPPHNALRYRAAIEHCVRQGAGVVIVDSMTHEHSGEGGLLQQQEKFLDAKCGSLFDVDGEEYRKRENCRSKRTQQSLIRPKAERNLLNLAIEQYGPRLNAIFCYRAKPKQKFQAGKEPLDLGWQPDTTSPLFYAMTVCFLLPPFSNGVPTWSPETAAEKLYLSLPQQFRGWFSAGTRLSPEVGERMARWARGEDFDVKAARKGDAPGNGPDSPAEARDGKAATPQKAAPSATAPLLTGIRELLATIPQERRSAEVQTAFGVASWSSIKSMEPDALAVGLAALRRNLNPLAAMAEEAPAERVPGED